MSVIDAPELDVHAKPTSASRGVIVAMAIAFFVLFLATGEYGQPYGVDPFTNAVQARAFADDQDPYLEELDDFARTEHQGIYHWLVSTPDGTVSQYPPGTALWATPFYLFNTDLTSFTTTTTNSSTGATSEVTFATPASLVPGTIAAALSVAIAMGMFGLTISTSLPARSTQIAMTAASLGTGAWSVAADKLWQHGPAMMWISVGTYFASRDRFLFSGLAFAVAVVTRPHSAIIAASIGLAVAVSRRSLREILLLGSVSVLGLVALSLYNSAIFDTLSPSGGYQLTGFNGETTNSPLVVVERLIGSVVHTRVGILWSSPFIVVAIVAAVMNKRRHMPDWAIGGAIGGFLYLVIQYRTNRLTGGSGFFSYRYPLEALMAAAPLLAFASYQWAKDSPLRLRVLFGTIAISLLLHGLGSIAPTLAI